MKSKRNMNRIIITSILFIFFADQARFDENFILLEDQTKRDTKQRIRKAKRIFFVYQKMRARLDIIIEAPQKLPVKSEFIRFKGFFFSIYIRQCTEARNRGSIRPAIIGCGRSNRGLQGLDSAVIETFVAFNYSVVKWIKLGKGALKCVVWLNEFEGMTR